MTPTQGSQGIAYLRMYLPGRSPLEARRKVLSYCSNIVEVPIKRRRNIEIVTTTSEIDLNSGNIKTYLAYLSSITDPVFTVPLPHLHISVDMHINLLCCTLFAVMATRTYLHP